MEYKLGELFNLQMGKTPDRHNFSYWNDGSNSWASIADLSKCEKYISETKEKITNVAVKESGIKTIPKDTVIMSFKLSIGKLAITSKPMYSNEAIMAFLDKHVVNISSGYLYYLLMQIKWLEESNKAVMGRTLNKATISQIKIKIHNQVEQKEIVERLDKIYYIIQWRKQQLKLTDDLIKSRFVEMFGDPILNDRQFETITGKDFFKLTNGRAVLEEKRKVNGIPAYGGNGISWYTDEMLCEEDTLVVGRVGFQSGNVHLVKGPLWVTDNAMYISEFYVGDCDLVFLCALMEHINFTRYQDAGDLKKITQKPFMQMEFIFPPVNMQKQYSAFVHQIDKLKVTIQDSLNQTQQLFDSLMQKYFG